MTEHNPDRTETANILHASYYAPLVAEIQGANRERRDFFGREWQRARRYAADQIQLAPRALSDLESLDLLDSFPTTIAEYVNAIRSWRELLTNPDLTSSLTESGRDLLLALGLGEPPPWAEQSRGTMLIGSCHILMGEFTQAWNVLTASAIDHPDIYPYRDLSAEVRMLLGPLAIVLRNETAVVQLERATMIDKPTRCDELLASIIYSTGQTDPAFASAVQSAVENLPRESQVQRALRLGLTDSSPIETLIGLWEAQPEQVNLRGPLPPCVISTVVVPKLAPTDDHILNANLRGGGSLTCRIDPVVAAAAAPALMPGVLVNVTILLASEPEGTDVHATAALITNVAPYCERPMALAGSEALSDPESAPDNQFERGYLAGVIALAIDMTYRTPETDLPAYLPPYAQAGAWADVNSHDLDAAHAVLMSAHPYTVPPPNRGLHPKRHYLDLNGFVGDLPPRGPSADGWRGIAEAIWSKSYRFQLAALLPGSVLEQLGGGDRFDEVLLGASEATIAEICLAANSWSPEIDSRWSPASLAGRYAQDGIPIAGLCAYRDVGMVDPVVAASFKRAGIDPMAVAIEYPSYLAACAMKRSWTPPPPWQPTSRRAAPKWVPWALVGQLPRYAIAGQALYNVLPYLPPQDGIDEVATTSTMQQVRTPPNSTAQVAEPAAESVELELNRADGIRSPMWPVALLEVPRLVLDLQEHLSLYATCIDMLCERDLDSAWVQATWRSEEYELYLEAAFPTENVPPGPLEVWARLEPLGWTRESECHAEFHLSGCSSSNDSAQIAVYVMVSALVEAYEVDPVGLHFCPVLG